MEQVKEKKRIFKIDEDEEEEAAPEKLASREDFSGENENTVTMEEEYMSSDEENLATSGKHKTPR